MDNISHFDLEKALLDVEFDGGIDRASSMRQKGCGTHESNMGPLGTADNHNEKY